MPDPLPTVVISYAPSDEAAARRIAGALRDAGIDARVETVATAAREVIEECALFVPLISSNTNAQTVGGYRTGWQHAVARARAMADDSAFLLPLVVDGISNREARVPEQFRGRPWMHVEVWGTPTDVVVRVREMLERRVAVQAAAQAEQEVAAQAARSWARQWLGRLPAWVRRLRIVWVLTLVVLPGGGVTWKMVRAPKVQAPAPVERMTEVERDAGRRISPSVVQRELGRSAAPVDLNANVSGAGRGTALVSETGGGGSKVVEMDSSSPGRLASTPLSDDSREATNDRGRLLATFGNGALVGIPITTERALTSSSEFRPVSGSLAPSVVSTPTGRRSPGSPVATPSKLVGWPRVVASEVAVAGSASAAGREVGAKQQGAESESGAGTVSVLAERALVALEESHDFGVVKTVLDQVAPEDRSTSAYAATAAQVAMWAGDPAAAVQLILAAPDGWWETPAYVGPRDGLLGWALAAAARPMEAEAVWLAAADALEVRLAADPADGGALLALAQVRAALGDRDAAEAALARFDGSVVGRAGGMTREHITVWAVLGDYEKAMNEIVHRFRAHLAGWSTLATWLRYDPRWSALREREEAREVLGRDP